MPYSVFHGKRDLLLLHGFLKKWVLKGGLSKRSFWTAPLAKYRDYFMMKTPMCGGPHQKLGLLRQPGTKSTAKDENGVVNPKPELAQSYFQNRFPKTLLLPIFHQMVKWNDLCFMTRGKRTQTQEGFTG